MPVAERRTPGLDLRAFLNDLLSRKGTRLERGREQMKTLLSLFFSMTVFTNCSSSEGAGPLPLLPPQTLRNVAYGGNALQRFDAYLPAASAKDRTPSIVLVHGGGWNGGSKESFTGYIDSLRRRLPGYAFFNLDYRLVNDSNLFPAQEVDIRSAIQFISSKAEAYRVDTSSFVLLGASAGAHLALLQAYKYETPRVRAVIDFFGPADLISMYNHPWHPMVTYALQMVTGFTPHTNPSIYRNSSPVEFINKTSPPTLIFHGGDDQVVDVSQSKQLYERLQASGVPSELVVYPKQKHGWQGSVLSSSFDTIRDFLQLHAR
jgi:acetyl esterase/lipase